ncbi:TetR-like C-terminal domain-containing protein [Nonomuraea zeae]|uniref:TetR family transcriptional regulator n=1 Tax=Nonomuraea zeae TaxID=1642303 RepID=A0A5S4GW62_9ACTN|nr:TetR/AcrR family transcriptional regulator C-terminal ligand-binding domain-containing protein [Nonomuraea zeae]TMR37196.1 TetR family transcriptional regulator [Nonomuraea zeae]
MDQADLPPSPALKPGRGRRRAEDVRRAVLAAAAELLLSDGIPGVTFAKVAALAGVSKMTLYKWWSSPGSLAFEAYFHLFAETLAFPDTGDIRRDLTTQLHAFAGLLRHNGAVIAGIVGAAQSDPDLAAALSEQYVRKRRQIAVERLATARQAGQIRPDVDLETIVDQLWGACYHRLLLPAEPIDTGFTDRLIANLFAGIAPPGPPGPPGPGASPPAR